MLSLEWHWFTEIFFVDRGSPTLPAEKLRVSDQLLNFF
jgi:hypothetical protein